jgi:hypothetical protein
MTSEQIIAEEIVTDYQGSLVHDIDDSAKQMMGDIDYSSPGVADCEEMMNATNNEHHKEISPMRDMTSLEIANGYMPRELRVRWLDTMSPLPKLDESYSPATSPTSIVEDRTPESRIVGLLRNSAYKNSATTNLNDRGMEDDCNIICESSTTRTKMSVQALQQQMFRLENKIKKAAQLELDLLNQSKLIREKRSRMMTIYEKMRRKLNQKTNSTSRHNPSSPQHCSKQENEETKSDIYSFPPLLYHPTSTNNITASSTLSSVSINN